MRRIVKRKEPRSFTEHRVASHATYDNIPTRAKGELRSALVKEQGMLCCYCMGRIIDDSSTTKLEHWAPRSQYPERQLEYRNILAACSGGSGGPSQQHCDKRKGDQNITIDPRAPSEHPSRLRYREDGTICVDDETLRIDIDEKLNLNIPKLKNNRKDALAAYVDALKRRFGSTRGWSDAQLRKEFARLDQRSGTRAFEPYVEVLLYWLRKRIERIQ